MKQLLLLGAGFSRNWGGWLAPEVHEYLIGCPNVNSDLRDILWKHHHAGGGFEAALAELEDLNPRGRQLAHLRKAVALMFDDMNGAFEDVQFEFQRPPVFVKFTIQRFLESFDAIFTLNQDLLLERHYLGRGNIELSPKWTGGHLPGMKRVAVSGPASDNTSLGYWTPGDPLIGYKTAPNLQPYFKLHGSSNWRNQRAWAMRHGGTSTASLMKEAGTMKSATPDGYRIFPIEVIDQDGKSTDSINDLREAVGVDAFLGVLVQTQFNGKELILRDLWMYVYGPNPSKKIEGKRYIQWRTGQRWAETEMRMKPTPTVAKFKKGKIISEDYTGFDKLMSANSKTIAQYLAKVSVGN